MTGTFTRIYRSAFPLMKQVEAEKKMLIENGFSLLIENGFSLLIENGLFDETLKRVNHRLEKLQRSGVQHPHTLHHYGIEGFRRDLSTDPYCAEGRQYLVVHTAKSY